MTGGRSHFLVVLWALALVVSLNSSLQVPESLPYWVAAVSVAMSACGLLWRPFSRPLLAISATSFLCLVFTQLPAVQNHRMVLAFIAVLLLLPAGGPRSEITGNRFATRQQALNALTVVVYVFAAVAKLNLDYLNPAVSCVGQFLRHSLVGHGLPESLADRPDVAAATAWPTSPNTGAGADSSMSAIKPDNVASVLPAEARASRGVNEPSVSTSRTSWSKSLL